MTRILRRNCQNLNLAGHQNLQVGMVNQESKRTTKGAPVSCRNAQKESEDQHLATMEWKASTQFAILPLLQFVNALATTYHHVNIEKWNLVVYGGLAAQSKTDPTPTDLQWQSNRFSNRGL